MTNEKKLHDLCVIAPVAIRTQRKHIQELSVTRALPSRIHSWFKQKRENRERKHNNVRKTYKIVIPRHTYRAGLVYHYWFELQLFHSQFFFCPTQGSISPSTSHAMGLKTGANKNIGTVKVTQNPLPLRDSKALGVKGATKIRVQKMMSRCRTLLKSYVLLKYKMVKLTKRAKKTLRSHVNPNLKKHIFKLYDFKSPSFFWFWWEVWFGHSE